MSRILLFYIIDDTMKATVVQGRPYLFVNSLMASFDREKICEIIDTGSRNNGYYYNAVADDYEFWATDKSNFVSVNTVEEIEEKKQFFDAVFRVDENKLTQI